MRRSLPRRSSLGACFVLLTPSGSIAVPDGVSQSGLVAGEFGRLSGIGAVLTADAMVGAIRSGPRTSALTHHHTGPSGLAGAAGELHYTAAALDGLAMRDVVSAINRHEPECFLSALARHNAKLALDLLLGIVETDDREQSGIW